MIRDSDGCDLYPATVMRLQVVQREWHSFGK